MMVSSNVVISWSLFMKRFVLIALLFFFTSASVFSQNQNAFQQGEAAMKKGNYQEAIELFTIYKNSQNSPAEKVKANNKIAECKNKMVQKPKPQSKPNPGNDVEIVRKSDLLSIKNRETGEGPVKLGMSISDMWRVVRKSNYSVDEHSNGAFLSNDEGYSMNVSVFGPSKKIGLIDLYDRKFYIEGTPIHPEMDVDDLKQVSGVSYNSSLGCYILNNNKSIRIYAEDAVTNIELRDDKLIETYEPVSQTSASPYLNVSKEELSFSADGGQESITVNSNNDWSISAYTDYWGHLDKNGNTLTLTVDANNTDSPRTDYFTLNAGGVTKRINITQSQRRSSAQTNAKNGVSMSGTTRNYTNNAKALSYLTECIQKWDKCRLGAITENGSGIVIYGGNGNARTGVNSSFSEKIQKLNEDASIIKSLALTNSGYYCVVWGRNEWSGNVPERMNNYLNQFKNNNEEFLCVSISENGSYLVITDKQMVASNSTDMSNLIKARDTYGTVKYACVTNLGLIVICQNGIFYSNIPSNLEEKLKSISFKPDKIVFTDSGTYLITNDKEDWSFSM